MKETLIGLIVILIFIGCFVVACYEKIISTQQTKLKYESLGYCLEDRRYFKYETESFKTDVKIINSKDTINGLLNGRLSGNIWDIKGDLNGSLKENNVIDILFLNKENLWKKLRISFEDISFKVNINIQKPEIERINTYKIIGPYYDGSNGNEKTDSKSIVQTKYILYLPELETEYNQQDNKYILK